MNKQKIDPIRIKTGVSFYKKSFNNSPQPQKKERSREENNVSRLKPLKKINSFNKKMYMASTSLNFKEDLRLKFTNHIFKDKMQKINLQAYKTKPSRLKMAEHYHKNTEDSKFSFSPNITNQLLLASLKQSKYKKRPISSKMSSKQYLK